LEVAQARAGGWLPSGSGVEARHPGVKGPCFHFGREPVMGDGFPCVFNIGNS
jgi:hypothetical protein